MDVRCRGIASRKAAILQVRPPTCEIGGRCFVHPLWAASLLSPSAFDELLTCAIAGDVVALVQLFGAHYDRLVGRVVELFDELPPVGVLVEDVVQQTWCRPFAAWHNSKNAVKAASSLGCW
jgi:hypothetical protein